MEYENVRDFTVEHRAGKKIPHVDALSRHVSAVLNDKNLRREVVNDEQAKDKLCQSLNPGTYQSRREFFVDQEGLIYRRRSQDRHRLVVPKSLIQDLIRANHDPSYIAHPGIDSECDCVKLLAARHAQDHRGLCPEVRLLPKKEGGSAVHCAPKFPEVPDRLFQITSRDITVPYPLTPRRNKYLLTFIDHFSKFAEAFAIPEQTAEVCARLYAREIFTRHGTGSVLVTDQGSAFMSSFLARHVRY